MAVLGYIGMGIVVLVICVVVSRLKYRYGKWY